ncbi:C6 transcription [Cordyceps militaris]|uniref:C6 transcription n=1 Tax=Cordyceps militaris TaxID=73501 RepID=A0A2H4SIV9_CORMI|nr:C6 transcription [Cordyceps militaris]
MTEQPAVVAAAQQDRPLRPLLPAVKKREALGPIKPTRMAKPPHTAAACDNCRKHKTKCSGDRPRCRRCAQRQMACHYTARPGETEAQALRRGYRALRARATEHEDVVALLRRLPDQDAQGLLARLRAGTPLTAIINHVTAGDALLQMAVTPETRFRYVFPYRAEMPASCVGAGGNPYLGSFIYDVPPLSPSVSVGSSAASGEEESNGRRALVRERQTTRSPGESPGAEHDEDAVYTAPFHAAHLVEPRLVAASMAAWTCVCDDEVLMRELLAIFFRCEYQFTSAFHKDYFLEDLAAGRSEFCSSLLVNLVLAYASVCNPKLPKRAEYWNPETLAYRFLAEARRLWDLDARQPHITTVQAGMLFSVFYNLSGLDEVGQAYRIHAVALANELGLWNEPNADEPPRTQRGKAFTAWTLYNWETLIAFSFLHAPLVKEVPKCPLPDAVQDPDWYGQLWVKYPASSTLVSMHFGQMFEKKTQFRIIMNEFCQEAYGTTLGVNSFKAEGLRRKLEHWFEHLPESLKPKNIVLPAQLQLHMYYYHLLLSIYEPLLDAVAPYQHTPADMVASSRRYMHTLIRVYFLRHGYEAMDLFIVVPLMVVADDCLELIARSEEKDSSSVALEELRATVMLIAKGLHDQRHNHYLAEALWRVLRGKMRRAELALLRGALHQGGGGDQEQEPQELAQTVRSHWPVSVVKKKEDLESKVLGRLVASYAHLNVGGDDSDDGGAEQDEAMRSEPEAEKEAVQPVGSTPPFSEAVEGPQPNILEGVINSIESFTADAKPQVIADGASIICRGRCSFGSKYRDANGPRTKRVGKNDSPFGAVGAGSTRATTR